VSFIVWSPGYQEYSGGVIALHRLAHNLALLGEDSFIYTPNKRADWLGIQIPWHGEIFDRDNATVIYPEIIIGNPLGIQRVVRWLLNTPGVIGGDGRYGDNDLVFKFAPYFQAPDESKVQGELRAFDMQLDVFKDEGRARYGDCYLRRKGAAKPLLDSNGLMVDNYMSLGGHRYLNQVFNERERFISYDHACFISVQAALSGCLSIVIPDGVTTEWKTKFPYFKYGIAYGLNDIEWARETQGLVRDHLIELEKESLELTARFVEICKCE
jgi:hypothetical protein